MEIFCVPPCSGHGQCEATALPIQPSTLEYMHDGASGEEQTMCVCSRFWSGTTCDVRFDHKMGVWWDLFIALTAILQGSLVLFGMANIIQRQLAAQQAAGRVARAFRGNYRDIIQAMTMLGSVLRCIWLVDPENFAVRGLCVDCGLWIVVCVHGAWCPHNVRTKRVCGGSVQDLIAAAVSWGLLLRGAQIAWFVSFGTIVLMWNAVLRSIYDDPLRNRCVNGFVVGAIITMTITAVPATILCTSHGFIKH